MKIIYLDNNATTRVAPEVVQAMTPYFTEEYFNPSSMYDPARQTGHAIAAARKSIADCLGGVDPKEILFTSCATESNNTAILGTAHANPNRKHVITTAVEHPAVLEVCRELERNGYKVTYLGVDRDGKLDMRELIRALSPNTLLVSIMHANNETGVIFPIEQLSRITKQTDSSIIFHTDATQTVGKLPIDLAHGLPYVDLLSFSGHKLHAPKGVGLLYVRNRLRYQAYVIGGGQERGRRGGTENVASIVGFGRAAELALANLGEEDNRVRRLRDRLEDGILESIPGARRNGAKEPRLPNTTNLAFDGVEAEGILMLLDQAGICASSGSACTTGSLDPSHVLTAMGCSAARARSSIRFSLGSYNTEPEVDYVLQHLPGIIGRLRENSPLAEGNLSTPAVAQSG